jgi:hypothetical protein
LQSLQEYKTNIQEDDFILVMEVQDLSQRKIYAWDHICIRNLKNGAQWNFNLALAKNLESLISITVGIDLNISII